MSLNCIERRSGEPNGFFEFYLAYPRKEPGRKPAANAYARAIKRGATPKLIMEGLARYPFGNDRCYQPHITTWLNQDRWTIERVPGDDFDPVLRAVGLTPEDYAQQPRLFLEVST
jgi:hypothetical protein